MENYGLSYEFWIKEQDSVKIKLLYFTTNVVDTDQKIVWWLLSTLVVLYMWCFVRQSLFQICNMKVLAIILLGFLSSQTLLASAGKKDKSMFYQKNFDFWLVNISNNLQFEQKFW